MLYVSSIEFYDILVDGAAQQNIGKPFAEYETLSCSKEGVIQRLYDGRVFCVSDRPGEKSGGRWIGSSVYSSDERRDQRHVSQGHD